MSERIKERLTALKEKFLPQLNRFAVKAKECVTAAFMRVYSRYDHGLPVTLRHLGGTAICFFGVCLIMGNHYSREASAKTASDLELTAAGIMLDTVSPANEVMHLSMIEEYHAMYTEREGMLVVPDYSWKWVTEYGRVNIREYADFDASVLECIVYGDCVIAFETEGDFTHINFRSPVTGENIEGYCYTAYLSDTPPDDTQTYLNVPLFKQADPRWGKIKIGGYETLASAGCTTTCLAMVESYENGESIYPDEMAASLYYTYDGKLTFPKRYSRYYGSDYLEIVLNNLQDGIPTLVSGYTSRGLTHWVVVVGYIGDGTSLELTDFLINDPGSYRTTLAEFFRSYPLFEKIVYHAG